MGALELGRIWRRSFTSCFNHMLDTRKGSGVGGVEGVTRAVYSGIVILFVDFENKFCSILRRKQN